MKKNRTFSFLVILITYVLAVIIGLVIFNRNITNNFYINVFIADVIATIFVFIVGLIFKNASIYDPYWSVAPIVIIPLSMIHFKNYSLGAILLLIAIAYWGIRLTLNWIYTFKNLLTQDWRYTMFQEKTKKWFPLVSLAGIHLIPTLIVYFAILPGVYFLSQTNFSYLSIIGLIISLVAATIQLISDIQVHKFRKNNPRNKYIDEGLWKYSRHPNYFGEVLMWWGVYLFMLFSDFSRWYLIIGAILNTLLFIFISIPMQEKRLLTYKDNYNEYQRSTSMLLILPKK